MRFVDRQTLRGEVRVLDAGHERTQIEPLRSRRRSRQAALRLALRGIERVLLIAVANEE